jgi:hypothetical protein
MGTSINHQLALPQQNDRLREGGLLVIVALMVGLMATSYASIYWIGCIGLLAALCMVWVGLSSLRVWCFLFLASDLILPPLYPDSLGRSFPVFIPTLLLTLGISVMVLRFTEFRWRWSQLETAGAVFLFAVAFTLPFSFWFSGIDQGIQSSLRFLLLCQPFIFFAWLLGVKPFVDPKSKDRVTYFILVFGGIAAAYGIYDFYQPVPIPHPFADQYIYLWGKMIRRAQGLLYESSNFGNFCAFLLALATCFLISHWKRLSFFKIILLSLLAGVFSIALFLAYSRASWANLLISFFVFSCLQKKKPIALIFFALLLAGGFLFMVYLISPDIFMNFFNWRLWSLLDFWHDPNFASSGRWENWKFLAGFFGDNPELLIFGIGYKSLSTTPLFGRGVIADNGYLSMLYETGVQGLMAFLFFNIVLLRTLFKIIRQNIAPSDFYAQFMFAFWIGEMVQMLTGDIFTYWRNLILFFTVIAMAITPNLRPSSNLNGMRLRDNA